MPITFLCNRQFNQDANFAKKAAQNGSVIITDRGQPAHVLLTFDAYRKTARLSLNPRIADLLAAPDAADIEVEFPPARDLARPALRPPACA